MRIDQANSNLFLHRTPEASEDSEALAGGQTEEAAPVTNLKAAALTEKVKTAFAEILDECLATACSGDQPLPKMAKNLEKAETMILEAVQEKLKEARDNLSTAIVLDRLRELVETDEREGNEELWNVLRLDQKLATAPQAFQQLLKKINERWSTYPLNLSGLHLSALPKEVCQLSGLWKLDVQNNSLKKLPGAIGGLTRLEELNADNNQLTTLPSTIGKCQNLRMIDVGSNQIEELPISFWGLRNLKELDLSNNQIQSIPSAVANLKQLKELNLKNNHLANLPEQLTALSNLYEVNVKGNPFNEMTPVIRPMLQRQKHRGSDDMLTLGLLIGANNTPGGPASIPSQNRS